MVLQHWLGYEKPDLTKLFSEVAAQLLVLEMCLPIGCPQIKTKGTPLVDFAFHRNFAAVPFNKLLAYHQPQP